MKRVLDAAGVRTPHHVSARPRSPEVWEAAEQIGYPLIVKPIAGAGSADTYRVDSDAELAEVLPPLRHVPEVSVEEFVDGEEFTFDTVCADGQILFEHVLWYRPRPLQMRHARVDQPGVDLAARPVGAPPGRRAGGWARRCWPRSASAPGFTHMEWYLKADGEAVFGEIGGRPPGARVVDLMNYATDGDLYVGWAEAVVHGRCSRSSAEYNAGSIFKRAHGAGRITHVEGLDALLGRVRRARRARRPAAGRRAAPRLAVDGHRRRLGRRPAPRAAAGDRDDRAVRGRPAPLRGLMTPTP